MNYLAHISEDKTREQSVLSHLKGTAELAGGFASEFGCEDWGYYVGMLHDIGKYSEAFQRRLRGSAVRVDHSTAGAKLSYERTGEGPKTLRLAYAIASYCIAGHHAGLPDRGGSSDTSERKTFCGRMKKKLEDYSAYESEVKLPLIRTEVNLSEGSKTPGFEVNFITRFLYSCLVDADYLDTESFMRGEKPRGRGQGESLEKLKKCLDRYIEPWLRDDPKSEINGRRTEILKHCLLAGEGEKGLYRLSVPTGGGKTIASLAFALRHALCHGMKRIIYVIPYTSIIEQNAAVFKEILGEKNVLEHHSNVDYEDDEELCPMQLAAENWDMPLIVTTNVQFFESLFSNRPSKCRKIHNIANSVLIFDEAQMLPKDYLQPCISSIEELIRRYHCSAVLCTATQPDIDPFLQSAGEVRELCPDMTEQFSFFRRCEIRSLGALEQETLLERLRGETQALCILNTRREVQEIYELLRKEGGEDGLYHLSTLMIPKHRRKVLGDIRERLKKGDGERCIVISTSLVEAGVDLDFASVYREIAGLDSIIQAAGRCNREGRRKREESVCHVFSLEDSKSAPLSQKQRIEIGSLLLEMGRDPADPDTIREYFWRLYGKPGGKAIPGTERSDRKAILGMQETDKKAILKEIERNPFSFPKQAEDLRLIEQNGETIFVPWDEEGRELLSQIEREGMSRKRARAMQQYSVNLYENLFQQLFDSGKFRALESGAKGNLYVLREKEDYSEEKGILLEAELGEGIYL